MIKTVLFFISFLFVISSFSQSVIVPAGNFTMGSSVGEEDEKPEHSVYLDTYSMDKYEVTYSEYMKCVTADRCTPPHYDDGKCIIWSASGVRKVKVPFKYRNDKYAVVCVTWNQARDYCKWKGKRLPSEAEWEKAAKSGKLTKYAWGNTPPDKNVAAYKTGGHPLQPGKFHTNGYNIFDMNGNVWEWVYDRYEKDYYTHSEKNNPKGSPVGRFRSIRGGGWYSSASQLRNTNRQWMVPERGEVSVGFRCAR